MFAKAVTALSLAMLAAASSPTLATAPADRSNLAPSATFTARGNGVRLPVMGWNPWNAFRTDVNETRIMGAANALVNKGLTAAGYRYVNLDDGWVRRRRPDGRLEIRTNLFPSTKTADGRSSLRPLTDRIHAMGLKLGVYSDIGRNTCAQAWDPDSPNLPEGTRKEREVGTMGFQQQDMQLIFAEWNADLIKVDACGLADFAPEGRGLSNGDFEAFNPLIVRGEPPKNDSVERLYASLANALRAVRADAEYVLSLCVWGEAGVRQWGKRYGTMWRTSEDIRSNWKSMLHNFDSAADWTLFAGPGHWNDPDMLVIGLGEFDAKHLVEARAHLSLWAILSAPLILGHDVANSPDAITRLVANRAVIAIDQDPAGNPGATISRDGDIQVLAKTLAGRGSRAVAFVNRGSVARSASIDLNRIGLTPGGLRLHDLWSSTVSRSDAARITVKLAPRETKLFRIEGTPEFSTGGRLEQFPSRINVAVDGSQALAVPLPAHWVPARPGFDPSGARLRAGAVPMAHGIGILANSRIEVLTDHAYRSFVASPSIQTGSNVTVQFRVYGDGRLLASQRVSGGDGAVGVPIRVATGGVRVLELVAENASRGLSTKPVTVGWLNTVVR